MNSLHPPSPTRSPARLARARLTLVQLGTWLALHGAVSAADTAVEQLAADVAGRGWILYAARAEAGDYDLFLSRPDGSSRRNLTRTPEWSEYGGRFSPDAKRILYRRQKKGPEIRPGESINHDTWGAMGALFIAQADGSNPVALGQEGELPWASWNPDGTQFACLYRREGKIRIVDAATLKRVRELPRQGVFQQMFWSPDGKRLCGTANVNGQDWNILAVDVDTGKPVLLSRGLNCTPDWFQHDPERVIYSHRSPGLGDSYGWTMLMQATADGRDRSLVYAERGRHVYYGCLSPDDRFVLFCVPETDGGTDAPMAIIRTSDAPIIVPDDYRELKALYPTAKPGPVLRLPYAGFEPHWTYAEVAGS